MYINDLILKQYFEISLLLFYSEEIEAQRDAFKGSAVLTLSPGREPFDW